MDTRLRRMSPLAWVVIAVLAAAGALALALGIGIGTNLDKGGDPILAAEANYYSVYNEDGIALDGPDLITKGIADFTLVNESTEPLWFAGWRLASEDDWTAERGRLDVGENMPVAPSDQLPGLMVVSVRVEPGTEMIRTVSMPRAWYVFDWATMDEFENANHAYRVAAIEAVE